MSEPLLDVTFEATPEDFENFVAHVARVGEFYRSTMQRNRISLVALLLLLPLVCGLLTLVQDDGLAVALFSAIPFWIAAAILYFAWPAIWRQQVRALGRRQLKMENPLVLFGSKRYIFDEAGVRYSGVHSGGYVTWPAIMRVTSDERALYLHVSQASAHFIPRRAFVTDAEFGAAIELATRLKDSAA